MKIDPKYFNTFLGVVALIAAILIAFFMFSNRRSERSNFRKQMMGQDTLQTVQWPLVQGQDSLRISDFRGQVVVLEFWSNWSDEMLDVHNVLARIKNAHSDSLQVIAAAVGMTKKEAENYMDDHSFPFQFVAGSQQFSAFRIPGLPAHIMFDQTGKVRDAFLGYSGEQQFDSLQVLLNNVQH